MSADTVTISLTIDGQRFSFAYAIEDASGIVHPTDRTHGWLDERIKASLQPHLGRMAPIDARPLITARRTPERVL